jgi:hypothetical protein
VTYGRFRTASIAHKLRLTKEDGSPFTDEETACRVSVFVTGVKDETDEILIADPLLRVSDFVSTVVRPSREMFVRPILLLAGMRLYVNMGRSAPPVTIERLTRTVIPAEIRAWVRENERTRKYPARWYERPPRPVVPPPAAEPG